MVKSGVAKVTVTVTFAVSDNGTPLTTVLPVTPTT